jgi:hypothetical protein
MAMGQNKEKLQIVQDYLDELQELCRANYTLPDANTSPTTMDVIFDDLDVSIEERGQGFVQHGILNTTWTSLEDLPTQTRTHTSTDNPDVDTLQTAIYDKLYGLRTTTLTGVGYFYKGNFGPQLSNNKPIVLVQTEKLVPDAGLWTGQEALDMNHTVVLLSRVLGASDATISDHLDVLEPLKDALQTDVNWSGKCLNSQIDGIDFGTFTGSNILYYETTIGFSTLSKDNL